MNPSNIIQQAILCSRVDELVENFIITTNPSEDQLGTFINTINEEREKLNQRADSFIQLYMTIFSQMLHNESDENDDLENHKVPLSTEIINKLEVVKKSPEMKEFQTCPICQDDFNDKEDIRKLPCGHFYHPVCIDEWFKINVHCPMCRKDIREFFPEIKSQPLVNNEIEEVESDDESDNIYISFYPICNNNQLPNNLVDTDNNHLDELPDLV